MDCGRCGSWMESPREGDLFMDGDVITCPDCATVNTITVDDDANHEAYVQGWTCAHGADDATPCPTCDAEDERAVSPGGEGGERG